MVLTFINCTTRDKAEEAYEIQATMYDDILTKIRCFVKITEKIVPSINDALKKNNASVENKFSY